MRTVPSAANKDFPRMSDQHVPEDRTRSTSVALADEHLHSRNFSTSSGPSLADINEEQDESRSDDEHDRLLQQDPQGFSAGSRVANTAEAADNHAPVPLVEKDKPVSWRNLPKKGQLAVLTMARLSEPLTQTSLQAYMFYQLKSFKDADGNIPSDAMVARQTGMLAAAFTGAQFLTAMMWGRISDSERMGRKRVILVGLLGTAIGSLGFGFSGSFRTAVLWRCVGGFLNGNIGVMRTMISETIREKKFQSRAFLLMPLTFNIGVIIGPLLGGILADPVNSYPSVFGPGSGLGGEEGVYWLTKWPYALPNVVNAVFLTISAIAVIFGLEETLDGLQDKPDYPVMFGKWLVRTLFRRSHIHDYTALAHESGVTTPIRDSADAVERGTTPQSKPAKPKVRRKLPFKRMFTRNLCLMLLSHGILALHVGTFSQLWFVFLSTPRYNPDHDTTTPNNGTTLQVPPNYHPHAPFTFTGGLALPPPSIGTALAILGVIGISLQLLLYPRLSFRLGTTRSYHLSLPLFPIAHVLVPYLAVLPSKSSPPHPAAGPLIWLGITGVLIIQVMARTFALPSAAILMNNSSPHPSVLGTVHGLGQSVSSGTRTVGPVLAGWLYGVGLGKGMVGLAWWCMAGVACVGAVAGRWVVEGNGHEILLEGEEEEEVEDGEERRMKG